jgi:hypothetical protein
MDETSGAHRFEPHAKVRGVYAKLRVGSKMLGGIKGLSWLKRFDGA